MIILTIVRHGESTDNLKPLWAGWADAPLSQHGMNQAKALGESLSSYRVDRIFASPLLRATWTAQQIQRQQPEPKPQLTFSPLLREQHFGKAERQPFASDKSVAGFYREPGRKFKFDGGESLDDVRCRADQAIAEFLEPLISANRGKDRASAPHVFVVAHGIFNSELLGALLARRPASAGKLDWRYSGMTNTGWTRVEVAYESEGLVRPGDQPQVVQSRPVEVPGNAAAAAAAGASAGIGAGEPNESSIPSSPPTLKRMLSPSSYGKNARSPSRASAPAGPLEPFSIAILTSNVVTHLEGLKRQQGGIGSSAHDDRQKDIRTFFSGS